MWSRWDKENKYRIKNGKKRERAMEDGKNLLRKHNTQMK